MVKVAIYLDSNPRKTPLDHPLLDQSWPQANQIESTQMGETFLTAKNMFSATLSDSRKNGRYVGAWD